MFVRSRKRKGSETQHGCLFFGFSASVIKLSHVKGRWSWCFPNRCVYLCVCVAGTLHTDVIHPAAHIHTLPLILPPAGRPGADTRPLPSVVSQPRGSDSSSTVHQLVPVTFYLFLLMQAPKHSFWISDYYFFFSFGSSLGWVLYQKIM